MWLAVLWSVTSWAQEATDQPLAIPVGRQGPERRREGRPPPSEAQERYEANKLSVRTVAEYYASPGLVTHYGWGWGGVAVASPPTWVRDESWAVFRGPVRIDVPTYLQEVGDTTARMQLEQRVQRNAQASDVLLGVGIAGGVAGLVGLLGMDRARTLQDLSTWSEVATVGGVAFVGGLVTFGLPASKARRLQWEPETTLNLATVQEQVLEHNRSLRSQLAVPDNAN